jgi:hypothetical protein
VIPSPVLVEAAIATAAPSVWVIDDGEKIRRDAVDTAFERGEHNPVWRPGQPVRVFAMQNETIGLQVVVEAGASPLDGVTVELRRLDGPGGASLEHVALARGVAGQVVGRPIETFVEHFVDVHRVSGGRTPGESLGWERGAGPDAPAWVGPVPDALIPVEVAPAWAPYPLRVAPRSNGIVWIDVNVPSDQRPGEYRGAIDVRTPTEALATLPVSLDIVDARLPDRTVGALLFLDREELERRVGPGAQVHAWKVLHAHRIAPMHDAVEAADVDRAREALDGSLYTTAHGYTGPAQRRGDGTLFIGAYGAMGDATSESLARVATIADAVAALGSPEPIATLLYADDEDCDSPRGAAWRSLLNGSADANARRVRVAWTCSENRGGTAVDVTMALAAHDAQWARASARRGQELWVYNGVLPRTGTFLIDSDAVSPRLNGWLSAMQGVPEWFYWEGAHWYDRRGRAAVDPYRDAESFHNSDGDWANGDGLLLYPGTQRDAFADHSLGFDGVVASIRLKNWRRGIEDAGYVQLARARDARRADAVTAALVPRAFGDARAGAAQAWSHRGMVFFDARRALLDVIVAPATAPVPATRPGRPPAARGSLGVFVPVAGLAAGMAGWFVASLRRRRERSQARACGNRRQ